MSTDDDREQRLDEQLRALARRIAEAAPPPIPFDELAERARQRHPRRLPLVAAGALVATLALVLAVLVTRDRQQPTVSSPAGEPIALEADGATSLDTGTATVPAARFRLPDGRQLVVAATTGELCARIGDEATPSCGAPAESAIRYVLVFDGTGVVVVAVTPTGSALAAMSVGGVPYTQVPLDGVVAFTLPTEATPFTIATYDAAGQPTGTVAFG
jgi:hypothetical protein